MADQGSGGSRLPLALPSASQGCSSGGGGSSAGNSGHPPPPRNLQGLLQMAITAGSEEPDPPPEPMSEERRQWLQEAMSAAFRGQREEVEQMKSCLRVLSQPTPSLAAEAELASDQQEREGALELLADLCENMDNAAGLVREQEAGLLQFLRLDGFSVLMRAMQQQVQKLKVKSAFLLQNLLVGHPEHKGTLCSMGMVQQLVALIRTEHSPFHEHVLGALCRYAGASEGARPGAGAPTSRLTPLGSSPAASSPLGFRTWEHSFLLTCGGLTRQPGQRRSLSDPTPPAPAAHRTCRLASGKDDRTEQRLEQVAAPMCGVAAGQAVCRAS
ncbi:hsp70-binding protein 1 isoform X3 [Lutra lutra]|uniref:hsp70-binding protein 1 isoform X3 n=1 Tax=Lutra lutra TaxID=9657 RepID=UPI001FD32762|nr:hsp70-binding protein 1 isoform X3 [Lutra lutra]